MAGYQAGTIFKNRVNELAQLRAQKNTAEALFLRQMALQDRQDERNKANQEIEIAKKVFDNINSALEGATPAEGQILRSRFKNYISALSEKSPILAGTLMARYPEEFQKFKTQAWFVDNPPPMNKMPEGAKASDNYALAAQDKVNQELYKVNSVKALTGKEIGLNRFHMLDEKMGVMITNDTGEWQLVNMEMINEDPKVKELREKRGISMIELQERGGDYDDSIIKVLGSDDEGNPYEHVMQVTKNVFGRKTKMSSLYSSKKVTKGPTHGEAPQPETRAMTLISHLSAGEEPDKDKYPTEKVLYDDIKVLGEEYFKLWKIAEKKKDQEGMNLIKSKFEEAIEAKLQQLDPEHVFVISPGPMADEKFDVEGVFFKNFKVANTSTIKAIYGKREILMSKDGKPVNVILDRANNIAYDTDGIVVPGKTIEAAEALIGSKTMAELVGGN